MILKPLLKHHRNPDHLAVVAGVFRQVFIEELLDKLATQDAPLNQPLNRFSGQFSQRLVSRQPHAKGKAKPLLFLDDDFLGQESAQGLFEEPAELQTLQFVVDWQA